VSLDALQCYGSVGFFVALAGTTLGLHDLEGKLVNATAESVATVIQETIKVFESCFV